MNTKLLAALILFLPVAASAEGFSLDVGIGATYRPHTTASNPVAVFRLSYDVKRWTIEYEHQSSIKDGPPFNDRIDDKWQERIVVLYRFGK